jgi:hypothetical protein
MHTKHTGLASYGSNVACYRLNLTDWAELGELDAVWRLASPRPKFISGPGAVSIYGRHHRIILALCLTRLALTQKSHQLRGGVNLALIANLSATDRGASVFSKVASQWAPASGPVINARVRSSGSSTSIAAFPASASSKGLAGFEATQGNANELDGADSLAGHLPRVESHTLAPVGAAYPQSGDNNYQLAGDLRSRIR